MKTAIDTTKISESLINEIRGLGLSCVKTDIPLIDYSYWRIGGKADLFIEPATIDEVQRLIKYLRDSTLPHVIIGDGCNLLFDDAGFRGAVVRIGRNLSDYSIEQDRITAQGGVYVPRLARATANYGLTGLEHTIGIPGTLGGLVLMNGGSLRKGVGENVEWVKIVDSLGNLKTLTQAECQFSYRHSALQGTGSVVVEVGLRCDRADTAHTRKEMLAILKQRRENFPRLPSCGSVFLNDPDLYNEFGAPGKVIEDTGLKGLRRGDIEISKLHANFMVNRGHGKSEDVLWLIHEVRQRVYQRTGHWLKCEVRHIAPDGTQQQAHIAADI